MLPRRCLFINPLGVRDGLAGPPASIRGRTGLDLRGHRAQLRRGEILSQMRMVVLISTWGGPGAQRQPNFSVGPQAPESRAARPTRADLLLKCPSEMSGRGESGKATNQFQTSFSQAFLGTLAGFTATFLPGCDSASHCSGVSWGSGRCRRTWAVT